MGRTPDIFGESQSVFGIDGSSGGRLNIAFSRDQLDGRNLDRVDGSGHHDELPLTLRPSINEDIALPLALWRAMVLEPSNFCSSSAAPSSGRRRAAQSRASERNRGSLSEDADANSARDGARRVDHAPRSSGFPATS